MAIEQVLGVSVGAGPNFSTRRIPSALGGTNVTLVKPGPGKVFRVQGLGTSSFAKFLKLYDKATLPVVGTDIPVMSIAIPAGGIFQHDLTIHGLSFSAGIAFAFTANAADSDTSSLIAGEVVGFNIIYL